MRFADDNDIDIDIDIDIEATLLSRARRLERRCLASDS